MHIGTAARIGIAQKNVTGTPTLQVGLALGIKQQVEAHT